MQHIQHYVEKTRLQSLFHTRHKETSISSPSQLRTGSTCRVSSLLKSRRPLVPPEIPLSSLTNKAISIYSGAKTGSHDADDFTFSSELFRTRYGRLVKELLLSRYTPRPLLSAPELWYTICPPTPIVVMTMMTARETPLSPGRTEYDLQHEEHVSPPDTANKGEPSIALADAALETPAPPHQQHARSNPPPVAQVARNGEDNIGSSSNHAHPLSLATGAIVCASAPSTQPTVDAIQSGGSSHKSRRRHAELKSSKRRSERAGRWTAEEDAVLVAEVTAYLASYGLQAQPPSHLRDNDIENSVDQTDPSVMPSLSLTLHHLAAPPLEPLANLQQARLGLENDGDADLFESIVNSLYESENNEGGPSSESPLLAATADYSMVTSHQNLPAEHKRCYQDALQPPIITSNLETPIPSRILDPWLTAQSSTPTLPYMRHGSSLPAWVDHGLVSDLYSSSHFWRTTPADYSWKLPGLGREQLSFMLTHPLTADNLSIPPQNTQSSSQNKNKRRSSSGEDNAKPTKTVIPPVMLAVPPSWQWQEQHGQSSLLSSSTVTQHQLNAPPLHLQAPMLTTAMPLSSIASPSSLTPITSPISFSDASLSIYNGILENNYGIPSDSIHELYHDIRHCENSTEAVIPGGGSASQSPLASLVTRAPPSLLSMASMSPSSLISQINLSPSMASPNPWIPHSTQPSALAAVVPRTVTEYSKAISRAMTMCPWSIISKRSIPGRTGVQAQARWSEALDPQVKKGSWTPEEDALLLHGVNESKKCWIWIADSIQGRTQRQCRTRWVQLSTKAEREAAAAAAAAALASSRNLASTSDSAPTSAITDTVGTVYCLQK